MIDLPVNVLSALNVTTKQFSQFSGSAFLTELSFVLLNPSNFQVPDIDFISLSAFSFSHPDPSISKSKVIVVNTINFVFIIIDFYCLTI